VTEAALRDTDSNAASDWLTAGVLQSDFLMQVLNDKNRIQQSHFWCRVETADEDSVAHTADKLCWMHSVECSK